MKTQTSESVFCGIMLALSGGCMDAYSYLFRGQVFANAQTGNMLLLGVHLAKGQVAVASHYLWPILAFTAGIILSDKIHKMKRLNMVHWRQISVLIEAMVLLVVAFLSTQMNALANMLISFACGIQVESFRTIRGNGIATTMCIGNLRSGTNHLDMFLSTRNRGYLHKALLYYGIILSFVVGAVIESCLIHRIGSGAILLSPLLLMIVWGCMFCAPDNAAQTDAKENE